MNTLRAVDLLLRLGVSFALLYPPFNAFLDPYQWLGYFPSFVMDVVPNMLLLYGFSMLLIVAGLWVLSGKHIFIPSVFSVVVFVLVVLLNLGDFQTLFSTVSVVCMAIALTLLHRPHIHEKA